jgi:hypothetical protein
MSTSLEDKDSPALKARLQSLGFEQVDFEPKVSNRFIVYIDKFPSYVIKGVALPRRDLNGKWGNIQLECYNPLNTKLEQTAIDLVNQDEVEITIKLLTPTAEVDTTWELVVENGSVNFGSINWSDEGEANLIYITFDVKEATISY